MSRLAFLSLLFLAFFSFIAAADTKPSNTEAAELTRVTEFLTGSFSSEAQSKEDQTYFDVRLHMTPIWPERTDEHWIYVEQALATALDKPYRQRVYHVVWKDGGPVSLVYTLPGDPIKYAGAWKQSKPLSDLTPERLVARDGCAIVLKRQPDGTYKGATVGTDCKSDLRGASYATSEVMLAADTLTSWDRGFDASGKQVWGAVKGPYVFKKER
jgi:hypothetical protein